MSINEKMTALANSIRELTGSTDALSIDGMTAEVDTVRIIKAGIYTLVAAPDTDVEPCNTIGDSSYFFADMPLHNTMKLSWSYGLYINNGDITLLNAPQSIQGTLTGTAIYTGGAYADGNSNKYNVGCDVAVPKEFYDWWTANTTKG